MRTTRQEIAGSPLTAHANRSRIRAFEEPRASPPTRRAQRANADRSKRPQEPQEAGPQHLGPMKWTLQRGAATRPCTPAFTGLHSNLSSAARRNAEPPKRHDRSSFAHRASLREGGFSTSPRLARVRPTPHVTFEVEDIASGTSTFRFVATVVSRARCAFGGSKDRSCPHR